MSSSTGVQPSEISILARWMPSRHRAGVILSPCLDGAGSPRDSWDDSFALQFVPLPASNSSSCISLDSLVLVDTGDPDQQGEMKLLDPHGIAEERVCFDALGCAEGKTSDYPIAQKLEELKELQRTMQEQLKTHRMEQLHQLLPESQRCPGTVSQQSSTDFAGSSLLARKGTMTEELWAVLTGSIGMSNPPQTTSNLPAVGHGLPLLSVQSLQCDPNTLPGRAPLDVVGERNQHNADRSYRNVAGDDDREELATSTSNDCLLSPGREDEQCVPPSEDRPIKPGVGSKKQTFEELLEEQLQLEEQRMKAVQLGEPTVEVKAPPKRTFLRRGEGLSRFTRGKAAPHKRTDKDDATHIPPRSSTYNVIGPSRNIQKNSVSQLPAIQRKTTVLNKENRPEHQPVGQEPKRPHTKGTIQPGSARVLGRNQRQNIMAPDFGRSKAGETHQQNGKEMTRSGFQGGRLEPHSCPPPSKAVVVTKYMSGEEISGVRRQMRPTPVAPQSLPEYSFELSFQEKLGCWDSEKLQENAELGEFELLEQAAEELSFSSNSSFVMKVLQLDRQKSRGGHHNRRLSSTPIKSPERSQSAEIGGCPPISAGAIRLKPGGPQPEIAEYVKESDNLKVKEVQAMTETDATGTSCHSSLELGDPDDTVQEVEVAPAEPALPGHLCFPAPSGALYDRMSYQDRDIDLDQTKGKESCEVKFDRLTGAVLTENGQARPADHFVFDDDDTWNDVEEPGDLEEETAPDDDEDDETRKGDSEHVSLEAISHAPSDGALKRKVAAVRGWERGLYPKEGDQGSSPPPTSQLVAKLFPSVKPKVHPAPLAAVKLPKAVAEQEAGPNPLSRQLRERLVELEIEIERFKEENAKLAHLKQQREAGLEALRKEVVAFEQRKAKELADLEEMKKEQVRKLQRERRVIERHASATRAMPDKKEREEIQALKQQLSSMQDELRRRESRWSNTYSRLRKQLETVNAENAALRDEVRVLEKLRVATWKKVEAEKEKSTMQTSDTFQASSRRSKSASPTGTTSDTTLLPSSNRGSVPGRNPPASGKPSVHRAEGRRASDLGRGTVVASSVSPDCLPHNSGALVKESCGGENEEDQEESQETITHPDGKIEHVLRCGGQLILFPNGTRKEVSADGGTVKITFFNGDIKQVTDDQQVIYYYAEAQTTHTTYPDGMEVLRFPNNQIEKHFPDGRKEITFPDQTVKNLFPDGKEESVFPDGTVIEAEPDGSKVIRFNNGQREVHTAGFKRREYPDGTAKTIYADGRQETRYPTGRLRIKDKDGQIIMDTMT